MNSPLGPTVSPLGPIKSAFGLEESTEFSAFFCNLRAALSRCFSMRASSFCLFLNVVTDRMPIRFQLLICGRHFSDAGRPLMQEKGLPKRVTPLRGWHP